MSICARGGVALGLAGPAVLGEGLAGEAVTSGTGLDRPDSRN